MKCNKNQVLVRFYKRLNAPGAGINIAVELRVFSLIFCSLFALNTWSSWSNCQSSKQRGLNNYTKERKKERFQFLPSA